MSDGDADDWAPPAEFEEFRLLKPLGRGAMGQVFLAYDTLLERKVAVKFIAGKEEPDPLLHEQFFVEARAIARLSHPNVVAIYRVGEVRRRPYLISELVRGRSLAEIDKPVDEARLVEIGLGLARGLAAAHRRGVLHCDSKPANAMITEDGEVKLLDFGLARLVDRKSDAAARRRRRSGDRLADVHGAGAVARRSRRRAPPTSTRSASCLYELATARRPHDGVPVGELGARAPGARRGAGRRAGGRPRRAACALIDRCLRRDPAGRWESARRCARRSRRCVRRRRARRCPRATRTAACSSFDAAHQGLFFGRENEARTLVDRLRAETLVVVTGDSGVGKSSLCRAGVLPRLDGRALMLVPGRQPLTALAAALAAFVGGDERELSAALRDDPGVLARWLPTTGAGWSCSSIRWRSWRRWPNRTRRPSSPRRWRR